MVITGLDLATRKSGWCVGDGYDLPAVGAWLFDQAEADLGYMLDQLDVDLVQHIETHRPGAIVYEAPILVVNRKGAYKGGRFVPAGGVPTYSLPMDEGAASGGGGYTDSLLKIRKLYALGAHVEFVCRRRGIECSEVGLKEIKREVTGRTNADKDAMVAPAVKVGLVLPATKVAGREDAADAWGAWLLALRHYDKQASRLWDRRIWSARGALL